MTCDKCHRTGFRRLMLETGGKRALCGKCQPPPRATTCHRCGYTRGEIPRTAIRFVNGKPLCARCA